MNTQFDILCTLDVTHAYYGGLCPDAAFVIPRDAARSLGRGRLIVKPFEGRLFVLYEMAEGGGPIVSAAGMVIRIGLSVANPLFANFTTRPVAPPAMTAVYDNVADAAKLGAPAAAVATGPMFSHTLSHDERPATITLTSMTGAVIATALVTLEHNRPSVSFDLTSYPAGAYLITEEVPPAVKTTARYYVDAELAQESPFGIVEIAIAQAFYAAPASFHVALAARDETLKYYVVARNYSTAEFDALAVVDAGFGDDERPQVTFTKVAPAAFTPADIQPALLGDADARIVMFRSDAPVTRRAKARQRIGLNRNGEEIVANLPQPGEERPTADLIVHLSKPKP